MNNAETVLHYHEATKHHFHRFAKSLGFMDWSNRPDPFRSYEGAESVPLGFAWKPSEWKYPDFYLRRRPEPRPLGLESLGAFLELSLGLSAWKSAGDAAWALRINPSSGNLHPTEAHLILPATEDFRGNICHYAPYAHALEIRAALDDPAGEALAEIIGPGAFLVFLTSIYWRESWKYGERAFRYCQHDAGHAVAALSFSAALLGWKAVYLNSLLDEDARKMLGFTKISWPEKEEEHFETALLVTPNAGPAGDLSVPRSFVEALARLPFQGIPNPLSHKHDDWEIIEEVSQAAEKNENPQWRMEFYPGPPRFIAGTVASAEKVIRQRRSGVTFDGKTALDREIFLSLLDATLPRANTPPFDAGILPPSVHLLLFVHRVTGLESGLYLFIRNAKDTAGLKALARPEFSWRPPEKDFPLFLLETGDLRGLAARVSCDQDIAGASSFSLGMIAKFRPVIDPAPWLYRNLFWECGMIGQTLYLGAEAYGLRGTGIGCFFDDPVHQILGLKEDTYQSLYHFTVGGTLEDERLQTLPPYHHLKKKP